MYIRSLLSHSLSHLFAVDFKITHFSAKRTEVRNLPVLALLLAEPELELSDAVFLGTVLLASGCFLLSEELPQVGDICEVVSPL